MDISIIPAPAKIEATGGTLHLGQKLAIAFDESDASLSWQADWLAGQLTRFAGRPVTLGQTHPDSSTMVISLICEGNQNLPGNEAYRLEVTPDGVTIRAAAPAGMFYGIQSLLQLFPRQAGETVLHDIPALVIEDMPRYTWRGMHLDVCRHFFPVECIKRYIDLIAMHKMNIFHWHLTEDQGWRIEIEKYPRLTDIGAWRIEKDGSRYGGFYTQAEIREVVDYAHRRAVTVVPEIEMPGHCRAALTAYPEYSCTGGPFDVPAEWGVFDDVYCPGREETFAFLENILDEVIGLFPGPYVHIGGDECPKTRWKNHDLCQQRMAREGLADEDRLQSYFISRIAAFLASRGKRMIGWDEILEGGLAPEAMVMSWRGMDGGIAAARAGHDVVMSPHSHCYFDFYQASENEPTAIGGLLPLEAVYGFDPLPAGLSGDAAGHILGGQGNVWTEYMADFSHVEYMAVPRMCALAEVLWSPPAHSYTDFMKRLQAHYARLDEMKVNYRYTDMPDSRL